MQSSIRFNLTGAADRVRHTAARGLITVLIAACLSAVTATAMTSQAWAQDAERSEEVVNSAPPYSSPMRDQCEEELIKDAKWRAELKQQLAPEIHQQDANQMLANRRHVVMAYALLWVLMLGFVVFMWMRQRGLTTQLTRLERELEQAMRDD